MKAIGHVRGPDRKGGSPHRILLVEDEHLMRDSLSRCLQAMGHTVYAAEDGRAGWSLFRECPVDLVVTDQLMPHLTGLELSARIRAEQPAFPIILITGFTDLLPDDGHLTRHVDLMIRKPFPPRELGEAIERVMGTHLAG